MQRSYMDLHHMTTNISKDKRVRIGKIIDWYLEGRYGFWRVNYTDIVSFAL